MKNTKISLINGLILTVTLFTSMQISSGEPRTLGELFSSQLPKKNTNLTPKQLEYIEMYMNIYSKLLVKESLQGNKDEVEILKNCLARLNKIYYGTKEYTPEEILDAATLKK
jgi:hypothetical protein